MKNQNLTLAERIVPFLILGIAIALLIGFIILAWYVLLAGTVIGLILFVISFLKSRFLDKNPAPKKGRIIEHDDD